jgi:hypothetical protein
MSPWAKPVRNERNLSMSSTPEDHDDAEVVDVGVVVEGATAVGVVQVGEGQKSERSESWK